MAHVSMRKGVWKHYGETVHPSLAKVVYPHFYGHPNSAATKRTWAMWGRTSTVARNAVGLTRAKKLITFCFNSRQAQVVAPLCMRQIGVSGAYLRNHCLGLPRAAQINTYLPFISFCRRRNFELPNNPQDMDYAPFVHILRFTRSGILVY
jgi:hypothetical protein